MLPELPLYLVVYYTILYRIISGVYTVGQKLPTRSELAADFSASEGTVRKSLALLAKQGYILNRSGSPSLVTLDVHDPSVLEHMASVFECRRGTLADILNTYQFVLPSVIHWGVSKMDRAELLALFQSMYAAIKALPEVFERLYLDLIFQMLSKTQNCSVYDYYVTTNLYLRLSTLTLTGNQHIRDGLLALRRKLLRWFAARLRLSLVGREKITRLHITAGIQWYIASLLRLLELEPEKIQGYPVRSTFCNFEPKYMSVCFSLIEKIYAGEYRTGDFLPSDTTAAVEYGVAVLTARKAYKALNEVGFTRTIPQVGTQVIFDARKPSLQPYMLQNTGAKTRISAFLDCLRFLKFCIREITLYACRNRESLLEDLLAVQKRCEDSSPVFQMYYLICALDCIVRHTHSVNFCAYFSLIKPYLFFGAYPLFSGDSPLLCAEAQQAFSHLAARETHAFSKCFESIFNNLASKAEESYHDVAPPPYSPLFPKQFTREKDKTGNGDA